MPRISIIIEDALDQRMNKFLPWGVKNKVMEALCENLCDAVETHGKELVGLILNKDWNAVTKHVSKKEV